MDLPKSPTRQFSLTIVVRVHRERLDRLRTLLDGIGRETIGLMEGRPGKRSMPFDSMKTIHYARWVLIDRHRAFMSGPQLVFSSNYDGPEEDSDCSEDRARRLHVAELVEHGHEALDAIYRCCVGYAPKSDSAGANREYLEQYLTEPAHVYPAPTFYIAAPGRSRDQILGEAELRRNVERVIDEKQKSDNWPPEDSVAIRRDIRAALGEEIPPFPPQPSVFAGPQWLLKQVGAVVLVLLAVALIANCDYLVRRNWPRSAAWLAPLTLIAMGVLTATLIYYYVKWIVPEPGRLLRGAFVAFLIAVGLTAAQLGSWDWLSTLDWRVHLGIAVVAFAALSPWKAWKAAALLLAFVAVATLLMSSPGLNRPSGIMLAYWFMILTVAAAIPIGILLYLERWASEQLRHLEATDPPFEPYNTLAEFSHTEYSSTDENRFFQNQLSNIAVLKPGAFRAKLLQGVFYALQLLVPTVYNKGKLGDIPTIHFARWVLIDNGRRVLFFSNFDSSWQSYLGDFIDKASSGLTAVWSNTVGYPRTRDLLYAGSEDADRFKAWARHIQIPTQVWYSAYPGLSVRNVNDNTIIRRGLAEPERVSGKLWLDALHGRRS